VEIGARAAAANDLDVVVALCETATKELRSLRGGAIWSQWEGRPDPIDAGIRETADDPGACLIVGTIDEVVVAYAAVDDSILHDGSHVGNLTDLYVLPEARGIGVGEAMMESAIDWCRARGCIGIDSIALPGDRATKNFFESFGLVARALRVHKSL
jgi:GNAT superfamily N-acetyltransferase